MEKEVCPVCAENGVTELREVTIEETEDKVIKKYAPCGHKSVMVTVEDKISVKDDVKVDKHIIITENIKARETLKGKVKNESGKTIRKFVSREKISKKGKEAKETQDYDIAGNRKRHHVEEKNEKGNWKTVHHEDKPLKQSHKNKK
jgi:hypothetical protein